MAEVLATILALVVALLGAVGAGYALASARRGPAPLPDVPRPDATQDKADAVLADRQADQVREQVDDAMESAKRKDPSGLAAILNERHPP